MAYTPASQWKKSKSTEPSDLQLPSGNVALVKAPGLEAFVEMGMIPNSLLDIMGGVLEANTGKQNKAKAQLKERQFMRDILGDPSKLRDVTAMADSVTVHCVVKPTVVHRPMKETEVTDDDGETRIEMVPDTKAMKELEAKYEDGVIYVDEVDMEDKMFIMNFAVGGTRAVKQFRGELAPVMELDEASARVVRTTKRTNSPKKKSKSKKR